MFDARYLKLSQMFETDFQTKNKVVAANFQFQISSFKNYQLDFTTPGSLPSDAKTLKQIRQSPNFLKYPRGRPQIGQRLYSRTLNLGFRIALFRSAFFATIFLPNF
jgi:hypothetical protein